MKFTVKCSWDAEAGVWYVEWSDVPGLAAEAATVEALNALLAERVPELLRLNMPEFAGWRDPQQPSFEVITHRHQAIAC